MSEAPDPRYRDIDTWDDPTALQAAWEAQMHAVAAIGPALPVLADVVADAVPRLRAGGRLVYAGAGSSIRIAMQDGAELAPTFGWPEARTRYLIAGGPVALQHAVEGAEDDSDAARAQVAQAALGADDVVIAVAASGRTPFTVAALHAAGTAGALTVALACAVGTPLAAAAAHAITPVTGPEVVAGSTRLKAGTAQKVVLNLLSTQIMLRLGHVHHGQMVGMRAANAKLRARATGMVARLAQVPQAAAQAALQACDWQIKPAILVAQGCTPEDARAALAAAGGVLRAVPTTAN